MILVVSAILLLSVLFLTKNKTLFKNSDQALINSDGLAYENSKVSELVNKDTDGDSVLDWEEGLWGTDPTKKDTDGDGVQDDSEITKLKSDTKISLENSNSTSPETLTKTDQFSQDLFTTIAALTQEGAELDQATIEKISNSLMENIENITPEKIYTATDIKIIQKEDKLVFQEYNSKIQALLKKYPLNVDVAEVINRSLTDDGEIDVSVLKGLDPAINQLRGFTKEMLTLNTPVSLLNLHLAVMNSFEKLAENLASMKLIDSEAIVAFNAINQYVENTEIAQAAIIKLNSTLKQILNNY